MFSLLMLLCAHIKLHAKSPNEGFEGTHVTYNIARLAVGLLLHSVEGFATQLGAAGHADEAVHVEDLVHGSAAGAFTHYVLSTAGTASCGEEGEVMGRLSTDSPGINTYNVFKVRTNSHVPLPDTLMLNN